MEGERGEQGESTESGTTSTQVDTPSQNSSEKNDEAREPEEDEQANSKACDGESSQEDPIATDIQDKADCLLLPSMPLGEQVTRPSVSSHPSNTQNRSSKPCWYCLRSLDSEYRPENPKQEDSDPLSPPPSSGQKVTYQTDPRPHFGVAWSSHSTCHPLWGSKGPCWEQRNQEWPDQTHTCPHCHLALRPDTLRWHEVKCLLFEGQRNSKK